MTVALSQQMGNLFPSAVALATTYDTTISTSTEITLNASTLLVVVTALVQPIFMKWGTADVTSSNWDYVIPAGTQLSFEVPVLTASTGARYTAVNFLEQSSGAILAVSEF